MKKRLLSIFLVCCMVFSLIPTTVLAANGGIPFTDVKTGDWFYDEVCYAYEKGLMQGTSSTTFAPEETTSRGMIVTILYRLEGEPTLMSGNIFTDVSSGDWYEKAVVWANGKGIVTGYGDGRFGPDDAISREQLAAIMYRYAGYKGYDTSAKVDLSKFSDSGKVSSYASDALAWANAMGLITGTDTVTLAPQGNATRAQAAAILSRFCEEVIEQKAEETPKPISGGTGGSTGGGGGGSTPTDTYYTVTFDSNGGSAVASQQVKAGECAVEPAIPTKDGYTFVSWYSDSELTNLFDFSASITANTTVYVKWRENQAEVHSFLDEPDPNVEINSFSTDTWDILVNTSETVTFTAEIFSNIEINENDISVIDEAGVTQGYMKDDGTNGDVAANDGIYTFQDEFTSDTVCTRQYRAKAGDITSDGITIGFYQEFTQEQLNQSDSIGAEIDEVIAGYLGDDGCIREEDYDAVVTMISEYLNSNNQVSSYHLESSGNTFSIQLESGVPFIYCLRFSDYLSGSADVKIVTYHTCKSEKRQGETDYVGEEHLTDGNATLFADTYPKHSFSTNNDYDDEEVTLDLLKELSDFGFVIWLGHGDYSDEYGSYLCIPKDSSLQTNNTEYSKDIAAGRIIIATGSGRYDGVTGGFFEKYVKGLNKTKIFLFACCSCKDLRGDSITTKYSLIKALLNNGAAEVVGAGDYIRQSYCLEMGEMIFARMREVKESSGFLFWRDDTYYTIAEALEYANKRMDERGNDYHATTKARLYLYTQENVNAIPVEPAAVGVISGSVKSATGGGTISNALVRVYDTDGNEITGVRTGSDGSYSVELPVGNYVIKATAGHYRSEKMAVTVIEDTTVYLETFLMIDNTLTVGTVSGIIRNGDTGQSVSDVTIRLRSGWNNRNGTVLATTTANSDGYYEFSNNVGNYTIEYYKSGFVPGYKNIVILASPLTQDAVIVPIASDEVYTITLSWVDNPQDLDSHLAGPTTDGSRFHMYYPYADANGGSPWPDLVTLDIDNTRISERPDDFEHVTVHKQLNGKYVYSVHDYSNGGNASSMALANSRAVVTVTKGDMIIATYPVPSTVAGTIWTVFELDDGNFTSINRFSNGYSNDTELFDPYYN